jgi:hypothetical protein
LPDLCSDSALRAALLELPVPLTVIAQDVLGLEGRIDRVARTPEGGIALVQRVDGEGCRASLTDALAHCDWLTRRLPDWQQLAPDLEIDPAQRVRALLVASDFDLRTRTVAYPVELYQWIGLGDNRGLLKPVAGVPSTSGAAPGNPPNGLRSTFRTGLRSPG